MRRSFVILLLIIISFLLQSVLFSFHNVRGIAPNLLLIVTMSFGIMRGRREGLLTGFVSGFLYDIFFGTLIGPYCFLFMIIGYLNGAFHKQYLMEDVMMPVFIIIVDETVFDFVTFVAAFLLRNRTNLSFYFVHIFLPHILSTVIATIVIYRIYVRINKAIKKRVEKNEIA
jgi:Cell shape-determining protein